MYVGGSYCASDLFYNQQHWVDQPLATLRIKCYQAAYLTEAWSSLQLIIANSPFNAAVLSNAVYFVEPPSNSTGNGGGDTVTINSTNLNLLFLLFLLVIPITVVLVAVFYLRHTQPYRSALVILAKLRAVQYRADNKRDTSHSPHPSNFEMAASARRAVGGEPAPARMASHKSASDEDDVMVDVSGLDALDPFDSSSQLGGVSAIHTARMEPLM